MQQRRRWNNSTFINLAMMIFTRSLWAQPRMWFPFFFAVFDLVGSILIPANVVLILVSVWQDFFQFLGKTTSIYIDASELVKWWLIIQFCITSTTSLETGIMFYIISTFFTSLIMLASIYHFVWFAMIEPLIHSFTWSVAIIAFAFVVLHAFASFPDPRKMPTILFYYIMLPTIAITIPMFSFIHLDEFSWGNR